MKNIWDSINVGHMKLNHRLAMAPMTRSRAHADGRPGDLAALYYAQRASLGLLISEGTQPSDDGQGYLTTPGIYTEDHIKAWKNVADQVHENNGYLYIQLMHVGRMSHPDNTPHHRQALAPSAIAPQVGMFTAEGMKDIPIPKEMTIEEIERTIQEFRHAAASAIRAGADGIEIHGASGYLFHQFFANNANHRTDQYGGTIENRVRFALEVVTAVVEEIGADRVGFRISPGMALGGIVEEDANKELYLYLTNQLNALNLAYLHIVSNQNDEFLKEVRQAWKSVLLVNRPDRALEDIGTDIENDLADIAPIGRWAIANPDFVERLKKGTDLNELNPNGLYAGGREGYTDYPTLKEKK
ncbi:alkene reductase [Paenibacillus sp. CFBP13512]|uniref:alkene reductase n=1 Tax=Paenibacillus sp. CFBP13512 TaxID=2184007 RepID=UPI0010BFE770|nr:alkene reductase [Paenibacillus sp. CFBP13512]TKJ92216.1 alkene reductase [Paenibacillus sp. CFBP13512]